MDIQFLGATQEVTGSCFLIRCGRRRVLVDCGLIQGTPEQEARNHHPFPFIPAQIDAVILTHAHLDHSGRLPLLVKQGFSGPIYTHRASRDLCRIMLKDAAWLETRDTEWENRKRQRKHQPLREPLYTLDDVQHTLQQFKVLDYHQNIRLFDEVELCLHDAGHILGSAIVELWLTDQAFQRKLVFSGDLGHIGAPILKDPTPITDADLVIMESTYGDRCHRSWDATWQELADIFRATPRGHGNILIPSFAVGRSQELLYTFSQHLHDWQLDHWQIFLDSPMAIEATEVYAKHQALYDQEAQGIQHKRGSLFNLPNLHISHTANQSQAINLIHDGAIIIAGSGMCNGGRIRHHFKHNLWRKDCQVILVGFQARGTLGRALVDGAHQVSLWGETVRVGAKIHTIGGLSAHADRDGLLDWYQQFRNAPAIALVHGEPEAIRPLATQLRQRGSTVVHTPVYGQIIDLE